MRVGFGCVNIGSASLSLSPREQVRLIQQSVDGGVDHFDTADAYGSGMSEQILGRALRDRRSEVTISTKAGYLFRERSTIEFHARRMASRLLDTLPQNGQSSGSTSGPQSHSSYAAQDFSVQHLRSAVEASLRRLGTDHIDVLLLHGPPETSDVFESLEDLRTEGKVGRFGIGAESLESAQAWVDKPTIDVIQLPFGLLDVEPRSDVFPRSHGSGVEFWARGVLGGGLLSAATRDISSVSTHPKRDQIRALVATARDAGLGIDELAIRWVRSSPDVALLLLGMSSFSHLDRNLAIASSPPLPRDVLAQIESSLAADDAHQAEDR